MKNFLPSFRQDFSASIVVFFVALPLCLGIALASGAPLFSGIIAGIVGGVVVGFFSGSSLGVSGPAAGLAVLVFGYITALGGSFEAFLLAVVLAGVIQLIAGFLRMGTVAYYFPSSVIRGMLSGIGLLIIIKQIPYALGMAKVENFELSQILTYLSPNVVIIALVSILILILWEEFSVKKHKFLKAIPGPLVAVFVGIALGKFIDLEIDHLVQIPVSSGINEFFGNFSSPDFTQLSNPQIYIIALVMAVVASLETLLCVEATDKMDPQKRITPANKELKAQGIGNIVSGLVGGLPITQVVVRSSANIEFGAKSRASTIFHGLFLLVSAISIPSFLNMIPLATLACVLIVVGYKLAKPQIFKKVYSEGYEQFAPFIATILGMLIFDLLKGVGIGMIVAIAFILYHNFQNACSQIKESDGLNAHKIVLSEEVSFLNKGKILQILNDTPPNSILVIDGTKSKVVHHDVIEIISDFRIAAKSKNISLQIKGIKLN
jgi:MFS superfamily sulfate permease-like transporter